MAERGPGRVLFGRDTSRLLVAVVAIEVLLLEGCPRSTGALDGTLEIGEVADTERLVLTRADQARMRKPHSAAHYKELMGLRRSNFLLLLLLMMELSYLCFGAFMFCSFERPGELERRLHLKMFRAAFLKNFTCLTGERNIIVIVIVHLCYRPARRLICCLPCCPLGKAANLKPAALDVLEEYNEPDRGPQTFLAPVVAQVSVQTSNAQERLFDLKTAAMSSP
ncbi:hypothetical protein IscW_ISCW005407 [Ixodes scapularis]|uniref:Uncharacterized protein n=1 Tax=Ixodes scapularis TaxID=6945 RepID=B7PP64_IXOSC|nr:hypothetical protein IscW_ISCW005407 [Ixodes scapularis]|eukprot:XP_002435556.1 hypothetical protein IscW_ISCW005407 [Ixodes scapularis]